ncbi:hypothetical protein MM0352_01140 [Helicobacter pylori]
MPIFLEVKKGLKKIIMSKKILIYTEGKSDRNFLGWYLNFLKCQDHFDIFDIEGKDKLISGEFLEKIRKILNNKDQTYKQVCIIFDADKKAMQVLIISLSIFVKNSKKKGLIFQENKSFYSLTIKMMVI